jgi:hypothetical protein
MIITRAYALRLKRLGLARIDAGATVIHNGIRYQVVNRLDLIRTDHYLVRKGDRLED